MSADTIRRAAALMRERAEAATAGPWHDVAMGSEGSIVLNNGTNIRDSRKPATCREFADAEHIASWHPDVALAVAELLYNEASLIASVDEYAELHMPLNGARVDLLLTIARTYLGEQP